MTFTSYRVDFKYTVENEASMFVVADSPEAAREGGKQMLAKASAAYVDAEITGVSEYEPQDEVHTSH